MRTKGHKPSDTTVQYFDHQFNNYRFSFFSFRPMFIVQEDTTSSEVKTWYTKVFFQSTCRPALEQSGTKSCRCYFSHIVQETSRQLYKIIKGFAYQAHQRQSEKSKSIPAALTIHAPHRSDTTTYKSHIRASLAVMYLHRIFKGVWWYVNNNKNTFWESDCSRFFIYWQDRFRWDSWA